MNIKITHLVIVIVAVLFFSLNGSAQIKRCEGFDKKVTYKILVDNITSKGSHKELYLRIYIKPEKITTNYMLRLVERIKAEYCEFDSIAVAFYDTRKMEKIPDPPPQPLIEWIGTLTRGFYKYDKHANTAELSFEEKRNNKIYSIEIEFNERGYCVSEELYSPDR